MTTVVSRQRLGNGLVRYHFSDGTHHDTAEERFSEMELRLIEAESFREAGGPSRRAEGAAASFVAKYHGQREENDGVDS